MHAFHLALSKDDQFLQQQKIKKQEFLLSNVLCLAHKVNVSHQFETKQRQKTTTDDACRQI